jgi:hypothetical protein
MAAMLDGRTIESLSSEELNSFSCKNILLFLKRKKIKRKRNK